MPIEEPPKYKEHIAQLQRVLAEREQIIVEKKDIIERLQKEIGDKLNELLARQETSLQQEKILAIFFFDLIELLTKANNVNIEFEDRINYYISYRIAHINVIYDEIKRRIERNEDLYLDKHFIENTIDSKPEQQQSIDGYSPTSTDALEFLEAIEKILELWSKTNTKKMPIPKIAEELVKLKELYSSSQEDDALRQQFYIKKQQLEKDLRYHLRQSIKTNKWPLTRKRGLFKSLFKKENATSSQGNYPLES